MTFRRYEPSRDREHVQRIWRECGWIESDTGVHGMEAFIGDADECWVADVDGIAECLVVGTLGDIQFQQHKRLPYGLVAAVTTSFVARRQGLAGRLTAHLVRQLAERGAVACGLGMFEQGFYDRLGFGSGNYEHFAWVAPDSLRVPFATRSPVRLYKEDASAIHACRLRRRRWHGSVSGLVWASETGRTAASVTCCGLSVTPASSRVPSSASSLRTRRGPSCASCSA